nr:MAG TPA: hypothetical protein [Caudoviricetes sp.]
MLLPSTFMICYFKYSIPPFKKSMKWRKNK